MVRIRESVSGVESGKHFGKWEVIGKPFSDGRKHWVVVVVCACGQVAVVDCRNLFKEMSVGCIRCANKLRNVTHGWSKTSLYRVWEAMKRRCNSESDTHWDDYGGRGIAVCQEWSESFEVFRDWALANGFANGLQIDRRDNDGNYEPTNCRWVTSTINGRNKRNNRMVEAFGEIKCLSEWASDIRCVVRNDDALRLRLSRGMAPEDAITKPPRQQKTK